MSSRALAWVPVILAVALRLWLLAGVHEPPDLWAPDGSSYLTITRGLLHGEFPPDTWIFPPGYPLCGAALSFLGGPGVGLVAASFLSGVLLVPAALLLGRRAGNPRAGFIAAFVLAVHPDLVLAGVLPLSEATFLAALAGCAILLATGLSSGSLAVVLLGGIAGGFSILTRPEGAIAVSLLAAGAAFRHRGAATAFAAAAAAVVLPYVVALHAAAGVWALSLKPYIFVPLGEAFQGASSYVEGRIRWERYWQPLLDANGAPDPRRLVAAFPLRDALSPVTLALDWIRNLGHAASKLSPPAWIVWIAGMAGLAWARVGAVWPRLLTVALAAPFLAAPFVQPPTGRFALAALPALAWGCGLLVSGLLRCTETRWPRTAAGVLPVAGVAAAVALTTWSVTSLDPVARDSHWMGRQLQVQVELGLGRPEEAMRIIQEGLRIDPEDPRFYNVLGYLRERQGDLSGAEAAYREAVQRGGDPTGLDHLLENAGPGGAR